MVQQGVLDAVIGEMVGKVGLRPGQRAAIDASLLGRDALVLLPTGGGKSLCFQAPAVVRQRRGEGPTLVVSPLVALMDDQVQALAQRKIAAVAVHGRARPTLAELEAAALIYASPERLASPRFRATLARVGISAIAVDEAHCIASWGHDFRPEYRELSTLRESFDVPIAAFTATATLRARDEIVDVLRLRDPVRVVGDLRRTNLALSVETLASDKERAERTAVLVGEAGRAIVYASSRRRVRALAEALKKAGTKADWYHAGRTEDVRKRIQQRFLDGDIKVLVATTAFGMGVDVPDVRMVVHAEAPGTLEGWWQEAGRAGRDGRPSRGVLLWAPKDLVLQARLRGSKPAPGSVAGFDALCAMARGTTCREAAVLDWLGEDTAPCGRCDACTDSTGVTEAADAAYAEARDKGRAKDAKRRADLSVDVSESDDQAIIDFVGGMRRPCSRTLVAKALRGGRSAMARRRGLLTVPGHGALKHVPEVALVAAIDRLLGEGRLVRKGKKYPTVWLPDKSVRPASSSPSKKPRPTGLAAVLKDFRKREARKRRWRAYQVFDNKTLEALASLRPATTEALLAVPGFGPTRTERYGAKLLALLAGFVGCHHPTPAPPPEPVWPVTVHIAATNDFHGAFGERPASGDLVRGGLPVFVGAMDLLRQEHPDLLVLDGGDEFQGDWAVNYTEGQGSLRAFDLLGVDVAGVGNHEFDYGDGEPGTNVLTGRLEAAFQHAPRFVAANITNPDGSLWHPPGLEPYRIVERDGVKIGVIGVTTAETPQTTLAKNVAELRFADVVETVRRVEPEVRAAGATVIVVVGHLTGKCDPKAFAVPGDCSPDGEIGRLLTELPAGTIDVLIAGHAHTVLAGRYGDTFVLEDRSHGALIGRLDLVVNADGPVLDASVVYPPWDLQHAALDLQCTKGEYSTAPLDVGGRMVTPSAAAKAVVDEFVAKAPSLCERVACSTEPLMRNRDSESALGDVVADAMLAAFPKADLAVTNSGGLRADLPKGELRVQNIQEVMPFENRVVLVELTGAQVRELYRIGTSGAHGSIQIAGGTVAFDPKRTTGTDHDGDGLVGDWEKDRLCGGTVRGAPIADDKRYQVVTTDFLVGGGDHLGPAFKGAPPITEGPLLRDAIQTYLAAQTACVGSPIDAAAPRVKAGACP